MADFVMPSLGADMEAGTLVALTAGNTRLATEPELINRDPYGEGWIMRVKPAGGAATETLDAAAYEAAAGT